MAMIHCPECGKEISEFSKQCVHCGCPSERFYSDITKDFTFAERKGEVFITSYNGKEININIPNEYNGKKIVGIGERAFAGTTLDDYSCGKIAHIRLPKSLKYIEKEAFAYCKYLSDIILPDSLVSIGAEAFKYCQSLQSISIPCGVKKLERGSFAYSGLRNIQLHSTLKELGDYCFDNTKIEDIKLPESVDVIGGCAFRWTPFLLRQQDKNPLVILNNILINGDEAKGNIVIPNSVVKISPLAFMESRVEYVKIPKSVKEIGWMSFAQCWNLKRVDLENGLTKIDNFAFARCHILSAIKIPISVSQIGKGAFQGCRELLIRCETPFVQKGWARDWIDNTILGVDFGCTF